MHEVVNDPRMPEEMRRTIERLRAEFIDNADQRILYIEAAISEIRDGRDCIHAATQIAIEAHGIAGLALSLGFTSLGQCASKAEQLWDCAINEECSDMSMEPARIAAENLMDQLEAILEPVNMAC